MGPYTKHHRGDENEKDDKDLTIFAMSWVKKKNFFFSFEFFLDLLNHKMKYRALNQNKLHLVHY